DPFRRRHGRRWSRAADAGRAREGVFAAVPASGTYASPRCRTCPACAGARAPDACRETRGGLGYTAYARRRDSRSGTHTGPGRGGEGQARRIHGNAPAPAPARAAQPAPAPERSFARQSAAPAAPAEQPSRPAEPQRPKVTTTEPDIPLPPEPGEEDEDLYNED